jgi:transposase-like protein
MELNIVSIQKQRDFDPVFKQKVIDRIRAGESVRGLSQELGIARQVLYRWRDASLAGRPILPRGGRPKVETAASTQDDRIAELERLVGQLTAENRFFKGALQQIKEVRRREEEAGATGSSSTSGSKPRGKAR